MTPFNQLRIIIDDMKMIQPIKENLYDLKQFALLATSINTIAQIKMAEIHREEDRIRNEEKVLPFTWDRESFRKLKEEMEKR